MSQAVPGARWRINYFVIVHHQKETLHVPAFSDVVQKLSNYGFLNPIELLTKQIQL